MGPGEQGRQWPWVQEILPYWDPFLVSSDRHSMCSADQSFQWQLMACQEREATGWFHSLHVTQQQCTASLATQTSSKCVLYSRFLLSHSLRLSSCSQQQFQPWDFSPILTLQPPAPMHTGGHMSLFVVCRAAAQIFSGSHSIQTIRDQLLHQPPTISNTFLLSQLIPPDVGFSPWLQLPNIQMQVWSYLFSSPFYFFSFILLISCSFPCPFPISPHHGFFFSFC